jgi:hypothetical protein
VIFLGKKKSYAGARIKMPALMLKPKIFKYEKQLLKLTVIISIPKIQFESKAVLQNEKKRRKPRLFSF